MLGRAAMCFVAEMLEARRLLCAIHDGEPLPGPLPSNSLPDGQVDHNEDYYVAEASITLENAAGPLGEAPSFEVNSAGLPLLTSRADGQGLKVFLDFDGHGTNLPFSVDGDTSTFNLQEQIAIYYTWRDMISYFSALNVNITTVQPPTGTGNPLFAWHLTSNSISGGYAYVGVLTNSQPYGFNQGSNAVSRRSGIAHEIGHLLGLQHQSEYNQLGTKTAEYSDGWDSRSRTVIGIDYNTNIRQWYYGRSSSGSGSLQDDLLVMANKVKGQTGGDGFRPDDFGNSIATASVLPADGRVEGCIERYDDSDVFALNVATDGRYTIDATPTYESTAEAKIELLDDSGKILAAKDDADQRTSNNNNDVEFSLDLSAGSYFVRVSSSGDISEIGEYALTASPLMSGFRTQDIGSVFRPGTATYDPAANTLIQMAGGSDIGGSGDEFRFTYSPLNGDGSVIIKVASLNAIAAGSKLAVMIRQSLAANSPHVTLAQASTGAITNLYRTSVSGATSVNATQATALGAWLQLARSGNTFTALTSADGISWSTLGSPITLAMTNPAYIGIAAVSASTRYVTYGSASNLAFTGDLSSPPASYNGLTAPSNLTATPTAGANTSINLSWTDVEGESNYAIERSSDGVNFTQITTVAANITNYTNVNPWGSMRWFYRVSARSASINSIPSNVASVVNKPNAPSDPPASYATKYLSVSTSTIYLNWRDVSGDEGYRIERSTDGVNYTQIATTAANYNACNVSGLTAGTQYTFRITPMTSIGDGVALPHTITASTRLAAVTGLAFGAKASNSLTINWTDLPNETGYRIERSVDGTNFASLVLLGANATSYTDSSVSELNEYYYRVVGTTSLTESLGGSTVFAATPATNPLPNGWGSADIGSVAGTGAAGVSSGIWTMLGAGSGIGSTSDNFRYTYRTLSGDGEITVRVSSLENTNAAAKAGVMIRESLTGNAKYAFAYLTPGSGLDFDYRANTGSSATHVDGPAAAAPQWLKLNRTGNVLTASYSADGTTWTQHGQTTLSMASNLYIGMALTSNTSTQLAKATFDNLTMTGATTDVGPILSSPASATPSPVTGTTTTLSVLATDDGGPANLTYAWSQLNPQPGVNPPVIANPSSTNTLVTFSAPGSYSFRATISDAQGNTITSDVNVQVNATATSVNVLPNAISVNPGTVQAFTAAVVDQFGNPMSGGQMIWTATRGSITSAGVWTAPSTSGPVTITASSRGGVTGGNGGGASGSAIVNVNFIATAKPFSPDANPQAIEFTVNGDLDETTLDSSDLTLIDLDSTGSVPTSSIVATYLPTSHTLKFAFPSLPNGALPDGNFRATLSGISDVNALAAASVAVDFFILAADATRDRLVDNTDFNVLAANFGASAAVFTQGDFDYDTTVSSMDFALFLAQYGKRLSPPPSEGDAVFSSTIVTEDANLPILEMLA
jgi:regulation of enolase protein 1 (concanavalin A-like superfamily)